MASGKMPHLRPPNSEPRKSVRRSSLDEVVFWFRAVESGAAKTNLGLHGRFRSYRLQEARKRANVCDCAMTTQEWPGTQCTVVSILRFPESEHCACRIGNNAQPAHIWNFRNVLHYAGTERLGLLGSSRDVVNRNVRQP